MKIDLKTINLELTTRCNLRCPYCYRTIFGPIKNLDFDMNMLKNIPVEKLITCLLCGTVGDCIFYPHLKEFIKECYRRNPRLIISIHTNGTAHNSAWWKDLANILKNKIHYVVFAIDGFEDTHKLHRIGGSYKRTMSNMKAFIDAGGNAVWQFVVFKHNEHQLLEASTLSKKLKCDEFVVRKSFFFDETMEKPDEYFPNLKTRTEDGTSSNEKIHCRIDDGEVSILANGVVMPCCHMIERYKDRFRFTPLSLEDKHLDDIIKDGYIQKAWSMRYQEDFCTKCRSKKGSYSIEGYILESLRNRKGQK